MRCCVCSQDLFISWSAAGWIIIMSPSREERYTAAAHPEHCCRTLTRTRTSEHITPVLRSLHGLQLHQNLWVYHTSPRVLTRASVTSEPLSTSHQSSGPYTGFSYIRTSEHITPVLGSLHRLQLHQNLWVYSTSPRVLTQASVTSEPLSTSHQSSGPYTGFSYIRTSEYIAPVLGSLHGLQLHQNLWVYSTSPRVLTQASVTSEPLNTSHQSSGPYTGFSYIRTSEYIAPVLGSLHRLQLHQNLWTHHTSPQVLTRASVTSEPLSI